MGWWKESIDIVKKNDPAARTSLEVLLTYPGLKALAAHRISHFLWRHHCRLLARMQLLWRRGLCFTTVSLQVVLVKMSENVTQPFVRVPWFQPMLRSQALLRLERMLRWGRQPWLLRMSQKMLQSLVFLLRLCVFMVKRMKKLSTILKKAVNTIVKSQKTF